MAIRRNPFHTLYLTEGADEVDLPPVFSPVLLPHVGPLFLPGNVVLKGMQGTGKSMLLSLLETNVRLAFWNNSEHQYPLADEQSRFVGAAINLSKSLALKLNELKFSADRDENIQRSQAVFSDFFNSWIVRDVLISLRRLMTDGATAQLRAIGITGNARSLDKAAALLSRDESCAFLRELKSAEDVEKHLTKRLRAHLDLVNSLNRDKRLPDEVEQTLTHAGEPISAATRALRSAKVIESDVSVLITVDQFETLLRKRQDDGDERKHKRFFDVIDDLIANRDRTVSYRLGSRPNALLEKSEPLRDYHDINLDAILQRPEHSKNAVFPRFAEDVFVRRLAVSEFKELATVKTPLKHTFGQSPAAAKRAKLCASQKNPEKAIRCDAGWPKEVCKFLTDLGKEDVLSAKLGEVWFRQQFTKQTKSVNTDEVPFDPDEVFDRPWESRQWWKKERMALAVLQIAAANAQRVCFFGESDIIALSGENILAFVSICREIWESWGRTQAESGLSAKDEPIPPFDERRQEAGIREASAEWHKKIAASPQGNTLQRLIDTIGNRLHEQLIKDRRMSYPGANGLTFAKHDLESDHEVKRLLHDATAEGFLLQREHTPKTLSRGDSVKWYPHPILAPYYELTVPHTKEPLYLTVAKFREWLQRDNVLATKSEDRARTNPGADRPKTQKQIPLFGEDD
jgi:hypothetical protein